MTSRPTVTGAVLVRSTLVVVALAAVTLIAGFLAASVVVVDISILLSVLAGGLMLAAGRLSGSRRRPERGSLSESGRGPR